MARLIDLRIRNEDLQVLSKGDPLENAFARADEAGVLDLYAGSPDVGLASIVAPTTVVDTDDYAIRVYPSAEEQLLRVAESDVPVPIPAEQVKRFLFRALRAEGVDPAELARRFNPVFEGEAFRALDATQRDEASRWARLGQETWRRAFRDTDKVFGEYRRASDGFIDELTGRGREREIGLYRVFVRDLVAYTVHCPKVSGAKARMRLEDSHGKSAALSISLFVLGGEKTSEIEWKHGIESSAEDGRCERMLFDFEADLHVLHRYRHGEPVGAPYHRVDLRDLIARRGVEVNGEHDLCTRFDALAGRPLEWVTVGAQAEDIALSTTESAKLGFEVEFPSKSGSFSASYQASVGSGSSYRVELPAKTRCSRKTVPDEISWVFKVS